MTDQSHFKYNASDILTHSAINYFETSELLPKVREEQLEKNPNTSKDLLIPTDQDKLNWNHFKILEKYICEKTKFTYSENEKMELVEDFPFQIES